MAYTLQHGSLKRESIWTNNLAVGSREYIEQNQDKFGKRYKIKVLPAPPFKVKRFGEVRFKTNFDPNFMDNITQGEDRLEDYAIHESQNAYNAVFTPPPITIIRKPQAKPLKCSFCPQKAGAKRKKRPGLERLSHKNENLSGSGPKTTKQKHKTPGITLITGSFIS
ncbi:MAG: hypothetical protein KKE12_09255 [Proteobacteria bacterium]|nr:hypothetical protein [Pseudomonadota bacterium]